MSQQNLLRRFQQNQGTANRLQQNVKILTRFLHKNSPFSAVRTENKPCHAPDHPLGSLAGSLLRSGDEMNCTNFAKRSLLLPAMLSLVLVQFGCADHELAPAKTQVRTPNSLPVTVVGETGVGNPKSPEFVNETINRFPSDFGPVPQERGQDKRPGELLAPNQPNADAKKLEFATTPTGTLVLYDTTNTYGWLGEMYAILSLNLASHFGAVTSKPVVKYTLGDLAKYKAVIYIGSTYDEPLPVNFLDDVLNSTSATQIIWIYDNIWQLANRSTGFYAKYGYNPWTFDTTTFTGVKYKGTTLSRDALASGGIMQLNPFNAAAVTVLATAVHTDGTTIPWAVKSSNLTYVGEIPYAYISSDDRYLAFCDMLFDVLAPATVTRHRALVRLEDVSPAEDAVAFKAIVDYLYSQNVPFSVATIPMYTDPLGVYNNGKAETIKWNSSAASAMLSALKYATTHGGTLVMHGYTHQYSNVKNPYSAVSADDFEFFKTHIDASNNVIYDGALSGDTATWATNRVNSGLTELKNAGLPTPTIFEYPHYAGTPTDSKAIKLKFPAAYHRGLYFGGDLGQTTQNLAHSVGQFLPYTATDIYGWQLKPENLGNYEPQAYNNHPPRLPADLIKTAQNNLVIRDGVASFFFHPYYPLSQLQAIVAGVKAAGYTFVSVGSL